MQLRGIIVYSIFWGWVGLTSYKKDTDKEYKWIGLTSYKKDTDKEYILSFKQSLLNLVK